MKLRIKALLGVSFLVLGFSVGAVWGVRYGIRYAASKSYKAGFRVGLVRGVEIEKGSPLTLWELRALVNQKLAELGYTAEMLRKNPPPATQERIRREDVSRLGICPFEAGPRWSSGTEGC